jgi:hypothetical protein
LLPDVLYWPDLPWPNPRLPVLTATATAWSAGMSAGTGIGAKDGDGTIEIGMMSREILPKAGAGRGAGTMATAVARAFFSRAGIHASLCDVTKTSRCGPA